MDIAEKLGIQEYEFRAVLGRTKVDFDHTKENINRKKHGYSLESAVDLLERYVLPFFGTPPHIVSDAFSVNEEFRQMHIGVDDSGKVVLMVTTMRPGETMRVISFRRAKKAERELFQELTGYEEK